ncbi:MAG: hypothetical protein AAFZ18_18910 [Myxococcota bacterium]
MLGRDDSPARRWMQSALLGGLGAMFFGPALGFPIMSRGPNFLTFFAALLGLAVVLTGLARWTRPNRAVRLHAEGWVLVEGTRHIPVRYAELQSARYEKGKLIGELSHGEVSVRLPRAAAAEALRAFTAALESH